MKITFPFACVVALALAGCSTTIPLTKVNDDTSAKVLLKDNRSPDERVSRRNGVMVPIQYFEDEDFDTPPLNQFARILETQLAPGQYELDVKKFRVVDIYPDRLKTATSAALAGALMSLGYSAMVSVGQSGHDHIGCFVSGSLGAAPVEAAENFPYEIALTSGLVKNDPSFTKAVNECLMRLSRKLAQPV